MQSIKNKIMDKLYETEKKYNVKIALAIEYGSRAWGFASDDSDYDCRFIYCNQKDWYLSVFDKKDIIEYAVDRVFDINGWDLKKVLLHISKSNAVMFEWLTSNEVYIKNEQIKLILDNLAIEFFNPISVSYHYLSIAKNKLNEILADDKAKLKKYFYVLRPIANLNYIYDYNKMPYMEYDKTLSCININTDTYDQIQQLKIIKKQTDESYVISKNDLLINYFTDQINSFTLKIKDIQHNKNRNYENIDIAFRNIIEMMW